MVVGDLMIGSFVLNSVSQFFGIAWGTPHNVIIAFPIGLLLIVLVTWVLRIQRRIKRLVSAKHRAALLTNFSSARFWMKAGLLSCALLLLGIAFLSPQWDKKDEQVVHEGRDIIIALDVSRSMLVQDLAPNRLEYAKAKIRQLVTTLGAERVGLLLFSGDAIMQCPLTTDYDAFFMFLDGVSVETMSSGTTSIGSALAKILQAFASFDTDRTRLVALFTDGEDFSDDLAGIKQQAIAANVHIFTVGVGTPEGAPVPLYDTQARQQGYQKDGEGHVVVSRLQSDLIQGLATETGGKYVCATHDDTDIQALKKWIEVFEKSQFADQQVQRLQEKFYYYSGAAFLLVLAEWLL